MRKFLFHNALDFESVPRCFLRSFGKGVAVVIFITGAIVFPVPAQDSKAEAAYEAAAGLFNLGLWEQATVAYEKYFEDHPNDTLASHAHYGLGLCYFNQKRYAEAAKELKLAASARGNKGPDKVEANLYLGQACMMQKPDPKPKDAELAFESSLKFMGLSKMGLFEGKLFKREWSREGVTKWLGKVEEARKKRLRLRPACRRTSARR